ncbi:Retrovirus-related Pol polyprotein from type-2 retrotransposable element R2DM [Symbiodinium microadriaticum]|uniref:Retrovirus-related Pol polyprotein from type-2 retrotransposable element R2DM n=1 Tax=Symbiodinium microadriaticum TaxID=2951 RepID=A0A1Q9EP91_SYMMI|nr:Retrovirus-related Pol polyprotein from type-2 retrotransposable element R2DM [Symbiodinium microadriaticum]CAE7535945.1 pol [Symbiodinium microadriaticum]
MTSAVAKPGEGTSRRLPKQGPVWKTGHRRKQISCQSGRHPSIQRDSERSKANIVCPCAESQKQCDVLDYTTTGQKSNVTTQCVNQGVKCPCGKNTLTCADPNDAEDNICEPKYSGTLLNSCPRPCTPEQEAAGNKTCTQTNLRDNGDFISETISCVRPANCLPGQNMQKCPSGSHIPTWKTCKDLYGTGGSNASAVSSGEQQTSTVVVLGSLHALTGVTNAKYQAAVTEFCRGLPSAWRQYPILCGFDANEAPIWKEDVTDMEISHLDLLLTASTNMNCLVDQCLRQDLRPVRPKLEQLKTPTHYPRDTTRSGRQIDMVWQKKLQCGPVQIDAERRHAIGTDHAALLVDVFVRHKSSQKWGNDSRPRWVVAELPNTTIVDEKDLMQLAAQCSRPRTTKSYQDDPAVKDAFCRAKLELNDCSLWKHAQKLRKKKRAQWQQERYTAILNGDWEQYRALQRERDRKKGWWGDLLNERSAEQLTEEVKQHLESKLMNTALPDWDDLLQEHIDLVPKGDYFQPFTILEVRTVLQEMKAGSAVGPDGVSVSLLRHIASHDCLGPQFLSLINHIVESLELPESWHDNFLALLAKVDRPKKPKDLRPICVSSALHKMITKLVCTRVMPQMRTGSRISGCGKGRQAADVIGCLSRVRDVVQEWKEPMLMCKLEISGAFDRIDRLQLVQFLKENLSQEDYPHELRYMLAQMRTYRLVGIAPGGNLIEVEPNVGIKQGAPESAELFGMVMDHLLTTLIGTKAWQKFGRPHSDLDVNLVFYQDDIFLLEKDFIRLCKRVKVLERYLERAGLKLATDKTKIIASPWVHGVRKARVGGDLFEISAPTESIRVLGLAFSMYEQPSQQAHELLGRTRAAAAKHQTLLRGKASWHRKVKMMETLVTTQFRWTAGAVHWAPEDLKQANTMQLHIMRNIFKMGRVDNESWVTWNTRTMRACRAWLVAHNFARWSTIILTLQHTLAGIRHGGDDSRTLVPGLAPAIVAESTYATVSDSSPKYMGTHGICSHKIECRGQLQGELRPSCPSPTSNMGCWVCAGFFSAALGLALLHGHLLHFAVATVDEDEYPGHLWEARWEGEIPANHQASLPTPWVSGLQHTASNYHDVAVYMAQSWDEDLCAGLQDEEVLLATNGTPHPDDLPLPNLAHGLSAPLATSSAGASLATPAAPAGDWLQMVGDRRLLRGRQSVFDTYVHLDGDEPLQEAETGLSLSASSSSAPPTVSTLVCALYVFVLFQVYTNSIEYFGDLVLRILTPHTSGDDEYLGLCKFHASAEHFALQLQFKPWLFELVGECTKFHSYTLSVAGSLLQG